MFVQPLVEAHTKGNIKTPRHWPLWGKSTGSKKGTVTRKMFPLDNVILSISLYVATLQIMLAGYFSFVFECHIPGEAFSVEELCKLNHVFMQWISNSTFGSRAKCWIVGNETKIIIIVSTMQLNLWKQGLFKHDVVHYVAMPYTMCRSEYVFKTKTQ